MRWNLGLAALSTSWGFVAVLVGAVALGVDPAGVPPTVARRRDARRRRARGQPASRSCGPGRMLPGLIALGVVQAVHWFLFFETVKRARSRSR